MAQGNGEKNGDFSLSVPDWVKAGFQWGFPSLVAMMLLAAVFGWIRSPLMDTLNRMEYSLVYQGALSRVLCNRLSQSGAERWQCEQPWSNLPPELQPPAKK